MAGSKEVILFCAGALCAASAAQAASCHTGYVPPDHRGHGEVAYTGDAPIGWTVVDFADEANPGRAIAVCRQGVAPRPGLDDVDFFEVDGVMHKLISGDVVIDDAGYEVTPKRAVRMKIFSTASAFPTIRTPWLYKLNHWREDRKFKRKTLSPHEYLEYLKANSDTCADLPLQDRHTDN